MESEQIKWTSWDIDAAYFLGVIASSGHRIPLTDTMPSLTRIRLEIERLKALDKEPHEIVRIVRYGQ